MPNKHANLRTLDYKGHESASNGTGPAGWMLWSGSQELSGSTYSGIGMELIASSESYLKFDASATDAELDIRAKKFFIGTEASQYISGSAGNIEISSSLFHLDPLNNSLIIGAGTIINADLSANQLFVPAGTNTTTAKAYISSSGDAKFVGDGAGNFSVDFSTGSASISGWTLKPTSLSSSNITIKSSGEIHTNDYVSNQTGWSINSEGAEFANVTVRGTLGTTVFEKDTISAVGGQVMIANATTYTGSGVSFNGTGNPTHSFSVANSGGWVVGEYVRAKATSSTGFVEEIMVVDSITPNILELVRKKGPYYIPEVTDGQVLISAGLYDDTTNPGQVTQSGYIHLNADPGDNSTPYIDIIERTGTGVNDTTIKARLGDLSGIASLTDPGYGLYSENVFLTGKITATSGDIGGLSIGSDKLYLGSGTHSNANTNFYVDDAGNFSLGTGLSWNSSTTSLFISGKSNNHDTIFYDDFSTYTTAASIYVTGNDPKTDGSGHGWFRYYSNGETLLATDENHIQGTSALQLGDSSGTSPNYNRVWLTSNNLAVLDVNALYEIEIRMKKTSNTVSPGTEYIGITGFASDLTPVQHNGTQVANNYGSQHYFAVSSGNDDDDTWRTYKGYFQGKSSTGNGGNHNSSDDPGTLHDDVVYIAPAIVANFNSGDSIVYVDYVRLSIVNPTTGTTNVSGDSISTGLIKSNNLSPNQGSTIDLNAGTISLGGSDNPRFNVDQNGLVTAVNFTEKYTTITAANLDLYILVVTGGVHLIFDGSQGGDITMNMQLNVDPGLIKNIIIPNTPAGYSSEIQLVINASGVEFDDASINSNYSQAAVSRTI